MKYPLCHLIYVNCADIAKRKISFSDFPYRLPIGTVIDMVAEKVNIVKLPEEVEASDLVSADAYEPPSRIF